MASFQSKVCEPKPHSGTRFQCASIDKSPAPLCFGKRTSRTPVPVDRRSKSGGLSRYETRRLRDKEAELTQKLQLRVQKTAEELSIVVVTYCAANIMLYLIGPLGIAFSSTPSLSPLVP